jgi:hypothetical protein
MGMTTFIAAVCLVATATVFAHRQNRGQELVTPTARTINWSSASALNSLFKDKGRVRQFLNEVANDGDPSGPLSVVDVFDYRFVDLNADSWLELVALVRGDRPPTLLEIVFQTPGGVPLPHLGATYEGFVIRELSRVDVSDLNAVLRDLDGDGTYEIVAPQPLGEIVGAAFAQAQIPEVFAWKAGDYVNVSQRYPEFYRDEVLPRLERQLQRLEALPGPADRSDRAARRADREKVGREIAEVRKRATQK